MIWKFALRPTYGFIGLYHNRCGRLSRSGTSTMISKWERKELAISLPRVCCQIYSETATTLYSQKIFAFRLSAPCISGCEGACLRNAIIRWLLLSYNVYRNHRHDYTAEQGRQDIEGQVRKECPNLVEMEQDDWPDGCLYATPAYENRNGRRRFSYPSSGDEFQDDYD